jgi:hypothetical protein
MMSYPPTRWDGSDDEDDAVLLFQSPVRSKSMMVMLSGVSPPKEEEEEEPSSVSTTSGPSGSSSASGVFRSPSTIVQFNPQSIYTGTYIQEVLQSFSSSSASSSEEMDHNAPRALSPFDASTLQRIGSLPSSCCDHVDSDAEDVASSATGLGDCYIFMDTEDEDDGDTDLYDNRTKESFLSPTVRQQHRNDSISVRTKAAPNEEESNPRKEEEIERHAVLSPMKQAIRNMLGGFKTKKDKRYTTSPSPLDDIASTSKHRISDLAVQAIAESCGGSPHSASITRNALVDFVFWEQAILNKQQSSFFLDSGTAKTSSSSLADDDTNDVLDDDTPGIVVKAVSLMVQDGSRAAVSPCISSFKAASPQLSQYDSILDEYDEMSRPSSEEVAQALNIEEEGCAILSLVRGRTGMVEDLHDPPSSSQPSKESIMIPWIHIVDDLWIPHYEEYVIRAVYAFSHQLLSFHTKKKKRPVLSM